MGSELLQIQVVGGDGLERDVIVTAAMPLFHLHRVLQFCIKPHQSDDTIAGQAFKFTHKSSSGKKTVLKAPKSNQLYKSTAKESLDIGTCWLYEAGKVKLELKVTDKMSGDAKHYVPRCIAGTGGNVNLDATNKKLFQRRFTKTAAYKSPKGEPGTLCVEGTTNEQIWRRYMNAMRHPLRWEQEFRERVIQQGLPPTALPWLQPAAAPANE